MDGNEILQKYVKAFYEQYEKNFENKKDPEEIIEVAVDLAYKDAQRTMKNIDKNKRDAAKKAVSEGLNNYLLNKIAPIKDAEFDKVHESLCDKWCISFVENDELTQHGNYGKAQKIVNMAFKYLYCYYRCTDSNFEKKAFFDFCHFTLDSFTLKWLNGCGVDGKPDWLDSEFSWSSGFKCEKYEGKCPGEYNEIKKYARDCVEEKFKDEGWTALEAEFFVWDNVTYYDCLKSLVKYSDTNFDNDLFSEELFKKTKKRYPSINKSRGLKDFISERKERIKSI